MAGVGAPGNDLIDGGPGADDLFGGSGSDIFKFDLEDGHTYNPGPGVRDYDDAIFDWVDGQDIFDVPTPTSALDVSISDPTFGDGASVVLTDDVTIPSPSPSSSSWVPLVLKLTWRLHLSVAKHESRAVELICL